MPLSFGPARPLVLFPVRRGDALLPANRWLRELRVRVYPDAIHVDSHEPELTAEEVTGASTSGSRPGARRTTNARARAAWQQLADRFDPPRAAWIARALQPLNPADRPATPDPRRSAAADATRVPSARDEGGGVDARHRSRESLPNQWTVLGYKNGQLFVNVTAAVIPTR